jgi:hypothetical protein
MSRYSLGRPYQTLAILKTRKLPYPLQKVANKAFFTHHIFFLTPDP